jgi:hypothetical protein
MKSGIRNMARGAAAVAVLTMLAAWVEGVGQNYHRRTAKGGNNKISGLAALAAVQVSAESSPRYHMSLHPAEALRAVDSRRPLAPVALRPQPNLPLNSSRRITRLGRFRGSGDALLWHAGC